jgi:hypothetical protein
MWCLDRTENAEALKITHMHLSRLLVEGGFRPMLHEHDRGRCYVLLEAIVIVSRVVRILDWHSRHHFLACG